LLMPLVWPASIGTFNRMPAESSSARVMIVMKGRPDGRDERERAFTKTLTMLTAMKIEALHVGLRIRHPQYGLGTVKTIAEKSAEIRFDDAMRTVDPELSGITPAEPSVSVSGLEQPLKQFVEMIIESVIDRLGYEKPDVVIEQLGVRWHKGRMVLHPADPTLQTKEVPLEVFFHKLVGVRNQLRVLEQKINAHPTLTDGDKIEMQQYITRCYGSLTTFNLLFKTKEDQFSSRET
jgi:hypothetical protein